MKWHLPLALFDDSGPVSNSGSTFVRVWYSLLGVGSERETRFLINTCMKNNDLPDDSWRVIMNNFQQLAEPVQPGKWGGIVLFLGSDLEYVCNEVGFPHYNSTTAMCPYCLADCHGRPHNNYQRTAAWRQTFLDNDEFMARLRVPLHPLAAHHIFNKYTYRLDLLHVLDHHGLAALVIANILWQHLSSERESPVLPGNTVDARLQYLNDDIQAYYTEMRVESRLPRLKLSNIKAEAWPELKGNDCKGSNTKALVPYVARLQARAVHLAPSDKQKHMLKVVNALNTVYTVLAAASFFLGPEELATLNTSLYKFGIHYQWLAVNAWESDNKTRWNTKPKVHFAVGHLGWQAALINPRFVQGYGGESMVGTMAEIYGLSMSGPYKQQIQELALKKYRTGMKFMWEGAQ